MFDIGFWELGLVFALGLLILGPERLPRVARNVGLWLGRARSAAQRLQREIERELMVEEARKAVDEVRQSVSGQSHRRVPPASDEAGHSIAPPSNDGAGSEPAGRAAAPDTGDDGAAGQAGAASGEQPRAATGGAGDGEPRAEAAPAHPRDPAPGRAGEET